MRKNTYSSETTTVVDMKTGEIASIETVKRQKITIDSEPFYMVFIDYMAPFFSLKSNTSKAVLSYLCAHAQFNTGRVDLSAKMRSDMMDELNVTKGMISITLRELCEKNLLSGEKGSYVINPQIFWKGDLKARNSVLDSKEFEISFRVKPENMDEAEADSE